MARESNRFKVGDIVYSRYEFNMDYNYLEKNNIIMTLGYTKNLELIVKKVITSSEYRFIYFFDGVNYGIKEDSLIGLNDLIKNKRLFRNIIY